MKMKVGIILTVLALGLTATRSLAADELTQHLQKGLLAEEALRNYDEALKSYQAAVAAYDNNRQAAATAVFRLAETYRKLGRTNEARTYYERVIREFSDQTNLVALSRSQIPAGAIQGGTNPNQGPVLTVEDAEIMRLRAVLKDSPDLINGRVGEGNRSALHDAASKGQVKVAEFLIQNGAKVNLKADSDYTPLHLAVEKGHKGLVELLLTHGAEPNPVVNIRNIGPRDKNSFTPLHVAAQKGFTSVLEVLLEKGATPDEKDRAGCTALHYAVMNDDLDAVRLLIKRKADPNLRAHNMQEKWTPLMLAVRNGNVAIIKLLMEGGAQLDMTSYEGWTALHQAVASEKGEIVDILLATKPNAIVGKDSALFGARAGIAEKLLKAGADVNVKTEKGKTPLVSAIEKSDYDGVAVLLRFKADLNVRVEHSRTPLMCAVEAGHTNIVTLLVKGGADLEAEDNLGYSALHYAVANGDLPMVDLLLGFGAKPDQLAKTGHTPLMLAQRAEKSYFRMPPNNPVSWEKLVPDLTQASAVERAALVSKLPEPFRQIGELLVQKGADEFRSRRRHIAATRMSRGQRKIVFTSDTAQVNRYRLYELVAAVLGDRMNFSEFNFPDFTQVSIERLDVAGVKHIKVNLLAALEAGDCSANMWLEWGDVIEIPEVDHNLNEVWRGLSETHVKTLSECTKRSVQLKIKGQTYGMTLWPAVITATRPPGVPSAPGTIASRPTDAVTNLSVCNLSGVIYSSKTLLASSDIKRIKVTRVQPETKEKQVLSCDLSELRPGGGPNDLWLRDGDVIEVPEKDEGATVIPPAEKSKRR